ncbi:hypothetical protein H8E77_31330 [bacterium]|nr:hypothetical protein [bacterium]
MGAPLFSAITQEKEKGVHKLTVKLPDHIYQTLREKSYKFGKPLSNIILEILEEGGMKDKEK